MWLPSFAAALAAVAAVPGEMTEMVVELRVNGAAAGPAVVERDSAGAFYVPAAPLEALQVGTERLEAADRDGRRWIRLAPGGAVRTDYDPAAQRLDLVLPPSAFRATRLTALAPAIPPMTPARPGFSFNYDLEATAGNGAAPAATGAFDLGLFAGPLLAQGNAIARVAGTGARLVRLDTHLTWDVPDDMLSLRVGDTITRGGVGGGPLRIGGLQVTRRFDVQPGFVTGPVPTLSGSAVLPSVADLYVNGAHAATHELRPGAFTLTGFPVVMGAGTVEMVVRDALGRETLIREAYYAAPGLLRAGLADFSYEIGFLRHDYAVRNAAYGPLVASATHRLGLTDRITVEGHAAASAETQQGGVAAAFAYPGVGLVSVSAAASRSGASGSGERLGIAFEHRSRGFSFGGSASLASEGYRQVGDPRALPALDLRLSASLSERWGALGLSYLRRDYRDGRPGADVAGANASFRLGRRATLRFAAQTALSGPGDTAALLSLSIRLDRRTSAGAAAGLEGGNGFASLSLQQNAPADQGWGYRALAVLGPRPTGAAALQLNTSFGQYDAELTYRDGRTGARLRASGGIGMAGGEAFAAQRLSDAFAVVDAGQPGVRVYADNHPVGRTGRDGRAVVPRLRSYEANRIRLEVADLPIDAEVISAEAEVRPYARSGVVVDMRAPRTRSAVVRLEVPGLGPVPTGATVTVAGRSFVAAPGGELFLSGLADTNRLEAVWPEGRCRFDIAWAAGPDPQPDLGTRTCRE
ncbi:MAG: fimbrial biogenesis outer membrane usher protein [Alphaproteobacteria bacterium]|nr:fimbrial biogenesis outer membrane usher protein [Alphaproteobacteria bacterium]MBV9371497.1 fimbrial biogenesis outer membrane usher protein [Alphaproteobacteria bacterium]MBV9902761.1 fimbrial biogenesis outer membrane usher protein [Alphaproteobacteria bacterium]